MCPVQSADKGGESRNPVAALTVKECAFVHTSALKIIDLLTYRDKI